VSCKSHYLFGDRFGRPSKGNDKGKVEGLVGYAHRNFLVPIPHAAGFTELNARLLESCRRRLNERLRGHDETIGERLERDRTAFLPLPSVPYEACEKRAARVTSLALVHYRRNDYSVPTAYGHREVLVRGYVHEVVIACGAEVIARHPRSYEREDFIFDPLRYLALPGAEDRCTRSGRATRRLELARRVRDAAAFARSPVGQVGQRRVRPGIAPARGVPHRRCIGRCERSDRRGVLGFDAVKHLVLCRIERRPPRLNLTIYPYLPQATVATTSARSYLSLLSGRTPDQGSQIPGSEESRQLRLHRHPFAQQNPGA